MVGLGWMELLIILACGGVMLAVPLVAALIVVLAQRRPAAATTVPPLPQRAAAQPARLPDDVDSRQSIVARLTQRFCPQCRTALATDAPEGLCPACLLAGGMGSATEGRIATEGDPYSANGLAATTTPSGSQPPARGEWADLQHHFPDLEIQELLGRGGMGSVYKARQKNLDRIVALKVIPPEAAKDPAFIERFGREARAMAKLNHPNIVTVYDYGHEGELCWLLMEYVDGVNLRHALRAGRLAPREALAIVPQICDALQYAHDQGVVHRDIKPENVLLDRSGRVKIADFGLAKLLGKGPDDFTLTRTQQVMGTPRYMAPEQIEKPTTVDHRADIYSLGVVIYEMLTGELPLGRFEPPSHKVAVDVRIDQVVLRTLEKEPERRYQRASQVKTELASAVSWPQAIPSPPPAAAPLPPQPSWHTPAPAAKPSSEYFPDGVPPGAVLGVAVGMVMGVLMMTAGLAAGIYAMTWGFQGFFSGTFWGWMGGGFGCLIGGAGSLFGSYNSYRQMTGAEDLMRSPHVTWFDWVMRGYLVFGILLIVFGLWDFADGNPRLISNWPCLLLGGVATFQAAIFLVWRMLVRPVIAAGGRVADSAGRSLPAEPGFARGVLLPAGAVLAVLAIMWVDVAYTVPSYGLAGGAQRGAVQMAQTWHDAVVLAGIVLVPLCLVGLGVWRAWGPRTRGADGTWQIPYPFASPGWLWGVAALAAAALVVPWFCLGVSSNAEVVVPVQSAYSASTDGNFVSFVARADELRVIAAMPGGFRYAHRGLEIGRAAWASALIALAAVLASLAAGPGRTWRGVLLVVGSLVGLMLIVMLLHDALNNPPWLAVDSRTEAGLAAHLTRLRGEPPHSVEALLPVLSEGFSAQPAIGVLLALAAGGLAFFLGVSELCWGTVATSTSAAALGPAKSPPLDPAREAIRRRVAGPAIGLMIAGAIGLLPELAALLVIPAVTGVPSSRGVPSTTPPVIESAEPAKISLLVPAAHFVASSATALTHGDAPLASAVTLPVLIAQEGPPLQMDAMPTWAVLMPLLAVFYLFNFAISLTLLIAGWRMRKLKSYGLSMVGAILALLPCSFGWFVGLPMGVWALLVLQRPEVREAFEA